jgi:hypothetical protein
MQYNILFYNSDRLFIVLSQYKKFGSLIAVCKESANIKNGYSEGYQVR